MSKKRPGNSPEVAYESSESSHSNSKSSSKFPSPLVNSRSFRKVRGANIQKLLAKENLQEEADDFWQQNKYFGDINKIEDSDDEYEKESSIKDHFDSDFFSEPEEENPEFFNQAEKEEKDENEQIKPKSHRKIEDLPAKKCYIHDFFSQEELLKEAAMTEIFNKKSLEDLVRLEEEKKKKCLGQKIQTDSPKMKLIDSYKSGIHEKNLYFTDSCAFESEFQWIKGNEEEEKKEIDKEKKKFKYRDPQTGERFNTVEELQMLRKKIQKEKKTNLKAQIKTHKALLEKKQQALYSLSHQKHH